MPLVDGVIVKYGDRRFKGATVSICVPSALPRHMRGAFAELRRVYTRPQMRRQGHAGVLLRQIADEADESKTMLLLQVDDEKRDLAPWYSRYGFVPVQDAPLLMVRPHGGMVNG